VLRGDLANDLGAIRRPPLVEAKTDTGWQELPQGEPEEMEGPDGPTRYVTGERTGTLDVLGRAARQEQPSEPPGSMASDPFAGTGTSRLGPDVADAFAPKGAQRAYGFRHKLPDGCTDNIAYRVTAEMATVETFYKTLMPQKGYSLVGRKAAMRGRGVSMTFARDRKHHYFVSLYPVDKTKQVRILLMIVRPAAK